MDNLNIGKIGNWGFHILAFLIVMVWGATFVNTKILLLHGLHPSVIFFLRFLVAWLLMGLFSHQRLWADNWKDELLFAALGISGGSAYFMAENTALLYSLASNVSLIVCSAPLWTALLVGVFYADERLAGRQVPWMLLSFFGVAVVVYNGQIVLSLSPKGDWLALAAAWLWAVYSLLIRVLCKRYNTFFISRKVFFWGVITILPFVIPHFASTDIHVFFEPVVIGNLLFLSIVASFLCFWGWNAAILKLGAVRLTNYVYLNPFMTILVSSVVLGEQISLTTFSGALLIVFGMWMVEKTSGGPEAARRV